MEKKFNLQTIEPVKPETMQIGHFTLPEFAQNLDKTVPDMADRKIADSLIGFMLNKDISAAEAKTILASIQNSPNVLPSTKDLALNAYNNINLKVENLVGIEKNKNQLKIENARAVAHDAFIDILSRHFHGVKLENLESDKKVSEFLLKNYPDIITSIKLQDPKNISIGNMTLFEAADKIEKNDTHGNYTFVSKMLVGFISGPEIRDSFDHEYSENKNSVKNKRQEFIQKFKDGKNGPLRTFFDSNRFKYKNLREIVDTSVYELLEVDFPKELDSQRAELYEKISTPKGIAQRAYDFMDDKEKEDAVAKVDEIARKTLEDILQKHLS